MFIFSHMKLQGEMEIKVCAPRNDLLKRKSPEWRGNDADPRLNGLQTESVCGRRLCSYTEAGLFDIKPLDVCILHQLDLPMRSRRAFFFL